MLETTIRFVAVLLITLTFALVVPLVIWGGPELHYRLTRPSTRLECAAVHPGMMLNELEDLVNTKTWPMEESLSANQFSFGSWEICEVELDPQTHKVVRAKMFQGSVGYGLQ